MGRPCEFKQETADIICARISNGESLLRITTEKGMPCRKTVLRWLRREDHPEFVVSYARAREDQADALFDECLDIADDARNDFMTKLNGDTVVDNEAVQRSRLRIDTRKWIAGKLRPKKYGEKLVLEDETPALDYDSAQAITMIARKVALAFRLAAMKEIEGGRELELNNEPL